MADSSQLPPWLARLVKIGFDSDDVDALISSIDASQEATTHSQLPAELLLQVLEFIPIEYVLDWRLVCRGFRDAIDGCVLYHHLQRVELIGYMGPRHSGPMQTLDDEQYDKIHLIHARFQEMGEPSRDIQANAPVWKRSRAMFLINSTWFDAFRDISGSAAQNGHTVEDADHIWVPILDRLDLSREEEGFGSLRWCVKLDDAVFDLSLPLDVGRGAFYVHVDLHERAIWVDWKDMMVHFLKTGRALRLMLEKRRNSTFTFGHVEDCLRCVRRERLHAALDLDNRIDRHIKWSLRLLKPLFGKAHVDATITLLDVEDEAIRLLLLLRREAAMSAKQLAYLRQLAAEYQRMQDEVAELDEAFGEFKSHLTMSGFELSIALPTLNPFRVARNPISWPDELRATIEDVVGKWKSQKTVINQMMILLNASNLALTVPENSFDDLDSDF